MFRANGTEDVRFPRHAAGAVEDTPGPGRPAEGFGRVGAGEGGRRDQLRLEVLAGRARSGRALAESIWGCPLSGGLLDARVFETAESATADGPVVEGVGAVTGPVLRRDLVWRWPGPVGEPAGTTRAFVALDAVSPGLRAALHPDRPAVPLERVLGGAGVGFTRRVLAVEHADVESVWFGRLRAAHERGEVLRVTRWWCLTGRPLGGDRLAVLVDEVALPPARVRADAGR